MMRALVRTLASVGFPAASRTSWAWRPNPSCLLMQGRHGTELMAIMPTSDSSATCFYYNSIKDAFMWKTLLTDQGNKLTQMSQIIFLLGPTYMTFYEFPKYWSHLHMMMRVLDILRSRDRTAMRTLRGVRASARSGYRIHRNAIAKRGPCDEHKKKNQLLES